MMLHNDCFYLKMKQLVFFINEKIKNLVKVTQKSFFSFNFAPIKS